MHYLDDKHFTDIRAFDTESGQMDGRLFRIQFKDSNIGNSFELNALLTGSAEADLHSRLTQISPLFEEKSGRYQKNVIENLFLNQFFYTLCVNLWNEIDYKEMGMFKIKAPIDIPDPIDFDEWSEMDIREYPGGKTFRRT